MTFRAAGTSLNGQAMGDDILVDVKTHFGGMEVREEGRKLWSRPGVILGDAQAVLSRHGFMLGPDPGSTSVCTIGGVLADNSGGMRCSLERDSYHSIEELIFVLPSGTIVDTSRGDEVFRKQEPKLHADLLAFRDKLRANTEMVDFLRTKFSIRNTNGLRIDAFLDEECRGSIIKVAPGFRRMRIVFGRAAHDRGDQEFAGFRAGFHDGVHVVCGITQVGQLDPRRGLHTR